MREMTCIGCPLGCTLNVKTGEKQEILVTGNTCKRGEDYALKEMTNPTRIVTSTVRIANRKNMVLPVKTERDIPKSHMMCCIAALKGVTVRAPVHMGEVVLENAAGTGVSVVATKNIE